MSIDSTPALDAAPRLHPVDGGFPVGRATFDPGPEAATALWAHLGRLLADERAAVAGRPVGGGPTDLGRLRASVARYDFDRPRAPAAVLDEVAGLLREHQVHTTHPRYFGLFNPTPTLLGVLGDAMAAAFNPQLAAWSHAPAAVEIERHLLRFLGARLGFPPAAVTGSFTSGGAEANATAVLLALTRTFPDYAVAGLRALAAQPVFYASQECHLAWAKIAHAAGLGRDAVRLVPVDADLRMDPARLRQRIHADRAAGARPCLVVGTAGTTGAGAIDDLPALADLCADEGLRFHVDAAYGGAVALSDTHRGLLAGIERSDSVTLDAHKWLSVPMGPAPCSRPTPTASRRPSG